jgi:predicted small lipoprotein YifL
MKTVILLLAMCVAVTSCGVRGDPEAPPGLQQTQ